MPVFEYKALDQRGKTVGGLKEADSPKTLRSTLRRDGIFLTEVLGQKEAAAAAKRDVSVRRWVGGRISAFLQEHISGMAVVQLFGRERDVGRRFRAADDHYLEAHLRSITYYALFFPIIELLTAVSLATIIAYGGVVVIDPDVSCMSLRGRCLRPMRCAGNSSRCF